MVEYEEEQIEEEEEFEEPEELMDEEAVRRMQDEWSYYTNMGRIIPPHHYQFEPQFIYL